MLPIEQPVNHPPSTESTIESYAYGIRHLHSTPSVYAVIHNNVITHNLVVNMCDINVASL